MSQVLRIGFDARAYDWTGIGRYVRNLVRELANSLSTARERPAQLVVFAPEHAAAQVRALPRVETVVVRDSYYSLYEQIGFLRVLRRARLDLAHFPNFNAPIGYRSASIVTIHDLTRFRFPGQRHRSRLHQWAYASVFRSAVQRARHVVAVSEYTRAALLERFPSLADRVSVIYEGVEDRFHCLVGNQSHAVSSDERSLLLRLRIGSPYVLYVGLWLQHKNLPGLVHAFRLFRDMGYRGRLVVTGEGRPWDEDIRRIAEQEGVVAALCLPGRVTDDELATLYRAADALVVPSFTEGFGFPPLEAMASGVPVVAARAGSLPEVLGDAVLFADPDRPETFAAALRLLMTDTQLRHALIERGRNRVARFTWARCASETLAVYRRVLKETSRFRGASTS